MSLILPPSHHVLKSGDRGPNVVPIGHVNINNNNSIQINFG